MLFFKCKLFRILLYTQLTNWQPCSQLPDTPQPQCSTIYTYTTRKQAYLFSFGVCKSVYFSLLFYICRTAFHSKVNARIQSLSHPTQVSRHTTCTHKHNIITIKESRISRSLFMCGCVLGVGDVILFPEIVSCSIVTHAKIALAPLRLIWVCRDS